MSRLRPINRGRTIVLGVLVASAVFACTTTAAAPAGDHPGPTTEAAGTAPRVSNEPDAGPMIAKARAAQRQHDWRSLREVQASLTKLVGSATIQAARTSYHRAMADLAAATARGDSHLRARFRAELRALCDPHGLVAAFESCNVDVAVWGN